METQQLSATASGRELDLEAHIQAVEKAARDWGMNVDELEGKFVSALLTAIAASGRSNIASLSDIEKLLDGARAAGDVELRRLKILLDGGEQVLRMAEEGARAVVATAQKTQADYDLSVTKLGREMAGKLLAETQKWLVLKQTSRNRRDAWRLAGWVSASALALFIGGYEVRAWQDAVATEAVQAMQEGAAQCAAAPLWTTGANGERRAACLFEQIFPNEPAPKPPRT
jgi:hypothetical protein